MVDIPRNTLEKTQSARFRHTSKTRKSSLSGAEKFGANLVPLVVLLSVFPVYLNQGPGFSVCLLSLIPLCSIFLGPRMLLKHFFVTGLACLYIIVVEMVNHWEPLAAFREPMFLLQFVCPCALILLAAHHDLSRLILLARILVCVAIVAAITVIIFRILPSVENSYAVSPFTKLFVSPSSAYMVSQTLGVNALDADKAAGILYLNGNQSAAYLIVSFALSQMVLKGRNALYAAAIIGIGVLATGSKTPLFAVPIAALLTYLAFRTSRIRVEFRIALFIAVLAAILIPAERFGVFAWIQDIKTFAIRVTLWSRAVEHLSDYILLGAPQGYWDQLWSDYGSLYWVYLPVHNYTLSILMVGGIGAVLLVYGQFAMILGRISDAGGTRRIYPYWAFFAFGYVILYAQVENFTVFGDLRVSIILAFCYALSLTRQPNLTDGIQQSMTKNRRPHIANRSEATAR